MAGRTRGFTLVEVVVVIVVLSILAAIAIPRYARYTREARIAALTGLAGAIRSSVQIVRMRYYANGTNTSPVALDGGVTVRVFTGANLARRGIPLSRAGGIDNAVNVGGTFVYTPGNARGTYDFPTAIGNCNVRYTAASGDVTINAGGC